MKNKIINNTTLVKLRWSRRLSEVPGSQWMLADLFQPKGFLSEITPGWIPCYGIYSYPNTIHTFFLFPSYQQKHQRHLMLEMISFLFHYGTKIWAWDQANASFFLNCRFSALKWVSLRQVTSLIIIPLTFENGDSNTQYWGLWYDNACAISTHCWQLLDV